MAVSKTISRRGFLKICTAGGTAILLAACGNKEPSGSENLPPLIPTEQNQVVVLANPTRTPRVPEAHKGNPPAITSAPTAPKGTPPANVKLPPNWTRGKVPRERTLVYNGAASEEPNCNPFNWGGALLEGFAYYSATADKTTLWMMESYQYSSDATELTLKFRPGIEWSDGKAFSVNDVKFGFETTQRLGWVEITSVAIVDDLTINVKLPKSDWRFVNRNLIYSFWQGDPRLLVPEHIFRYFTDRQLSPMDNYGPDAIFNFFDPEKNYPVVTGPYMMVKTDPEIHKEFNYVPLNMYDLRPDWWAVKTGLVEKMPDVERVITVMLEETPEMPLEQFTKKNVDYCDNYRISLETIPGLIEQARDVSTWTGDQPPYGHVFPLVAGLGFNCQQAPFNDPRVRWAIAYAIDQREALDRVYGKNVEVAKSPFPEYSGFTKLMSGIGDLADEYNFQEFSPTKFAELMQKAGFDKNAAGQWADRNGAPIELTLYADGTNTWSYYTSFGELANKLADQLRQAGFACQVQLFEISPEEMAASGATEMADTWTLAEKGLAPMFITDSLGEGIGDPLDLFTLYTEKRIFGEHGEYNLNVTRWQDDSFTAATSEMKKISLDDPRIPMAFRRCMEIWYKNLPFIPLCQTYNRVPYSTRYWQNWPSAENPYTELGFNNRNALMLVINLKAQL